MPRHRLRFGVKSTPQSRVIEAGKSFFFFTSYFSSICNPMGYDKLGKSLSVIKTTGIASNLLGTLLREPFNVTSLGPVLLFDPYPLTDINS